MLKRRKFLKTIGAALAGGISIFSTRRAFSKSEGMEGHGHMVHSKPESPTHGPMEQYPPVGWANPNLPISAPPPLMGKQMGRVHTLNVPPLGYEMDGDVKVFSLIMQPVKRLLTTGGPPSP